MDGVYKALAHPARRRILGLLRSGPQSAGALAEHFDSSKPTLSGHLGKLAEAGLVRLDKQGNSHVYSLNTSVLKGVLATLCDLAGVSVEGGPGHV